MPYTPPPGSGGGGGAGSPGPAGQGFRFRGPWSSATAYAAYDVVTGSGNSFVALLSGTNQPVPTPGSSNTYWATFAQVGAVGTAGAAGATGPTGAAGGVGPAGTAGAAGAIGPAGAVGPTGTIGPVGNTGPAGTAGPTGATGGTGPAGAVGPTGAVGAAGQGFTLRGAWSSATAYAVRDVVTSGGSSFVAVQAGTNQALPTPGSSNASWATFAQAGAVGAIGPAGTTGPAGAAGAAGATGPAGVAGPSGATGPTGATGQSGAGAAIQATAPWTPGTLANLQANDITVAVAGATMGATALASLDVPLAAGVFVVATVIAAGSVRATLMNFSGASQTVGAATVRVDVH